MPGEDPGYATCADGHKKAVCHILCVCMCVCMRVNARTHALTHTHTHNNGEVKGTKECIRQEERYVIRVLKVYKCKSVGVYI